MINRFLCLVCLFFSIALFSCNKDDVIQDELTANFFLSIDKDSRITEIYRYQEGYGIRFDSGYSICVNNCVDKIALGVNGCWCINDRATDIAFSYTGFIPSLFLNDEKEWVINGYKTGFYCGETASGSLKAIVYCIDSMVFFCDNGFQYSFPISITEDSIIDLNPQIQYDLLLKQLRFGVEINDNASLVLCHFSDIHGDKNALKRVLEFCNSYNEYIDDIIHTGDSVYNDFRDDFSFWKKSGANHVLNCIGNHDIWEYNESGFQGLTYKGSASYNRYFAPFISNWSVTQPIDSNNAQCFYYKDYHGIRLIVVDCYSIDTVQLLWIKQVLDDSLSNNLSVVIAAHETKSGAKNLFTSFSSYKYGQTILNGSLSGDLISLVDYFIDNGGDFICWLMGHSHLDFVGLLPAKNTQLSIIVEAATNNKKQFDDVERLSGTKNQDAFNIVSFSIANKMISIVRVGNDIDGENRNKHALVIDYKSGRVVSDW